MKVCGSAEEKEQNGSDFFRSKKFAVKEAKRDGGDDKKTSDEDHQEISYDSAPGGINHDPTPVPRNFSTPNRIPDDVVSSGYYPMDD